jgi:hypothetical protein
MLAKAGASRHAGGVSDHPTDLPGWEPKPGTTAPPSRPDASATDYTPGGGTAQWDALAHGVNNNPRGMRTAVRMLGGLAILVVVGMGLVRIFG